MSQDLPFDIKANISLKAYNTFGFDYYADYLVEVNTIDHLKSVLVWAKAKQYAVQILGGGSNILLQGNLQGLVIVNRISGIEEVCASNEKVEVSFGAGEIWHECVQWAVENGYGGIENLALIPGTAGAAPVQNIGAYGVEIKDVIKQVTVFDREVLEIKQLPAAECGFGYRESHFKHDWQDRYVIVSVTLNLTRVPKLILNYGGLNAVLTSDSSIRDVFNQVCKVRSEKLPDPNSLGNAGSFFKNPVVNDVKHSALKQKFPDLVSFPFGEQWKLAAGWMNDKAGWKGVRQGGVGVYDKQALVLVNYSDVVADGLLLLEQNIKHSIYECFGVILEREPVLLGERRDD